MADRLVITESQVQAWQAKAQAAGKTLPFRSAAEANEFVAQMPEAQYQAMLGQSHEIIIPLGGGETPTTSASPADVAVAEKLGQTAAALGGMSPEEKRKFQQAATFKEQESIPADLGGRSLPAGDTHPHGSDPTPAGSTPEPAAAAAAGPAGAVPDDTGPIPGGPDAGGGPAEEAAAAASAASASTPHATPPPDAAGAAASAAAAAAKSWSSTTEQFGAELGGAFGWAGGAAGSAFGSAVGGLAGKLLGGGKVTKKELVEKGLGLLGGAIGGKAGTMFSKMLGGLFDEQPQQGAGDGGGGGDLGGGSITVSGGGTDGEPGEMTRLLREISMNIKSMVSDGLIIRGDHRRSGGTV